MSCDILSKKVEFKNYFHNYKITDILTDAEFDTIFHKNNLTGTKSKIILKHNLKNDKGEIIKRYTIDIKHSLITIEEMKNCKINGIVYNINIKTNKYEKYEYKNGIKDGNYEIKNIVAEKILESGSMKNNKLHGMQIIRYANCDHCNYCIKCNNIIKTMNYINGSIEGELVSENNNTGTFSKYLYKNKYL